MSPIKELPQVLINKIAAGEVIERPASVVKELMENSLDAGASRITIQIEDGGKKLIRVIDNGQGMDHEDLSLACRAHATSKLQTEDDLYAIGTLGFRGEALASIASISQMEILSRQADAIEGGCLKVDGGQAEPLRPASATTGTTITVQNLFYNTPARRKFLRTTNTELGHITEQFSRIALAYPAVHFVLEHNGRRLNDLSANQSLRERIAALFDRDLADGLISVNRADRELEVAGMIAPPQQSRAGTQWQYIFLNGRYIRDRFVRHAIREGYRGLMEINRQPVVFLFLRMDPSHVDVNVHPTKIEVRFENSNQIHSIVLATIRERLLSTDLSVPLGRGRSDAADDSASGDSVMDFGTASAGDERKQRVRQAIADFYKSKPPGSSAGRVDSGSGGENRGRHDHAVPPPSSIDLNSSRATGPSTIPSIDSGQTIPPMQPKRQEKLFDAKASGAEGQELDAPSHFMQIHNRFLVVQSEEGVLIIDQHALHERILYEQLYEQVTRGSLESQRRLIPETVQVNETQLAAAEQAGELLDQLGIVLESFGPKTLAVQGFPSMLNKVSPGQFVCDLLDLLVEQAGKMGREELLHQVLDMMACKAAVKAGDPLTDEEIRSLLARRHLVDRSSNCPHGRPTTLKLSLRELEKEFKRT